MSNQNIGVSENDIKTLLSTLQSDNQTNKLFFGKKLGMQRYDKPKYKVIDDFYPNQTLMFWKPNEIGMEQDARDYKSFSPHLKKIYTSNLGYQIILDTIQSRGITHLLEYVTNLELERAFKWWEIFENLHSTSYTHIIQSVYPNPSEMFDELEKDENILKRVYGVTKYYDSYINSLGDSEYDLKKKLWLTLVSIQILEGVRFYVSFACTYFFDSKLGKMHNTAKIIWLINRDENLHFKLTKDIIKILRDNPEEGFQDVIKDTEDIVQKMWLDASNEEIEWAKYLFEEKPEGYEGFNAETLTQFMKYRVNTQMKVCGFEKLFPKTLNPFGWIDDYINSDKVQNAPQEGQNTAYTVAGTSANGIDELSTLKRRR